MRRVDLGKRCDELSIRVDAAVAIDFADHAAVKAVALVDASLVGNQMILYKLLRAMKPWVPKHEHRLCDEHGVPAPNYHMNDGMFELAFSPRWRVSHALRHR